LLRWSMEFKSSPRRGKALGPIRPGARWNSDRLWMFTFQASDRVRSHMPLADPEGYAPPALAIAAGCVCRRGTWEVKKKHTRPRRGVHKGRGGWWGEIHLQTRGPRRRKQLGLISDVIRGQTSLHVAVWEVGFKESSGGFEKKAPPDSLGIPHRGGEVET